MIYFDKRLIEKTLDYPSLVNQLKKYFSGDCSVPQRIHFDYKSGVGADNSTLLLMPAWVDRHYVGLKTITISPHNRAQGADTIQGLYTLIDARDGRVLAQYDGHVLTNRRTAASSALASSFLSREDSKTMLIVGTGALSPEMVRAHCAVRSIETVMIWGRSKHKADDIKEHLSDLDCAIEIASDLDLAVKSADIISTVTSSPSPLVRGQHLKPGQHLDLVGAFKPDEREADESAITNSTVFVDTRDGAMNEAGEILIPIKAGVIDEGHIKGDLFQLCKGEVEGRRTSKEITAFISVGYALEDLAAAILVWERYK